MDTIDDTNQQEDTYTTCAICGSNAELTHITSPPDICGHCGANKVAARVVRSPKAPRAIGVRRLVELPTPPRHPAA